MEQRRVPAGKDGPSLPPGDEGQKEQADGPAEEGDLPAPSRGSAFAHTSIPVKSSDAVMAAAMPSVTACPFVPVPFISSSLKIFTIYYQA